MIYRLSLNKKKIMWPIFILRYLLPIFSFGFYGQIFLMFTTIFYCRKQESSTSPYLKCRVGHWFNNIKPIAGIAMFLNFLIAFITNSLYYKPIFIRCNSDLLKKSNSFPDILLLFTKMIVITIFILDKGVESEHWAILSFLVLVTGTNAYFTISYKTRQNRVLLTLNNFFSATLFLGFLILFISKIFKFLEFNGSIFLFFSSALLILLYISLYKSNNINIYKNYKNIYNPDEYLQFVSYFYDIIKNKNNSRNYLTNLKSLISSLEENCIDKNCPLNKYITNLEKGFDFEYLLLHFCEKLFQYGISKFKGNIFLKNNFSLFLINEMNNKKKALSVLESIKNEYFSFQTKYNIYRCRRIIENYTSSFINKNKSLFNHKNDVQQLKLFIKEFTFQYNQFLHLLWESKVQNVNNIQKLNEIGYKLIILNKKIENVFIGIINTKTDNMEIIQLYSSFVEHILKDEEKNKKCQDLKQFIYSNNFENINENDHSNFHLELLKGKANEFLTVSSQKNNLGTILDCSINICKLFGYQKNELIGKHINTLIPEIFHYKHNLLVKQKVEESKLNFLEGLCKNTIYIADSLQKDIYCISKSKFLIPINIKVSLVNTEENELVYIIEISHNISFNKDLLNRSINPSKYCVLTDKNLFIQNFTSDCINNLNINYEDIGYHCNIIKYIKEIRDEYLSSLNNPFIIENILKDTKNFSIDHSMTISKIKKGKQNISNNEKEKIKNDIFNRKFLKKSRITWIYSNENKPYINEDNNSTKNKILNENGFELYLEPKKIILDNELLGYYFYFSKIYNFGNKCYLEYKTVEKNDSDMHLKNIKKYKCIYKCINIKKDINKINIENGSKRNSIGKLMNRDNYKVEDKISIYSNYEQDSKIHSKYSSTQEISEIKNDNDIIIDENFIPNNLSNFSFDIKNFSYSFSKNKNINNNKILNEELKNEASGIIKAYNDLKIKKENHNKSNSFNSSSVTESDNDNENEEISSSNSNSKISETNSNENSKNEKNNKKASIYDNLSINKSLKEFNNNNVNKEIYQNHNIHTNNNNNNSLLNNYYKVDLSKIHFMIYDFNKDSFIEGKDIKKISEIDNIILNLKKEDSINFEKDEIYLSFKNINKKINSKHMNKNNDEKEKIKENLIKNENINNQEKYAGKINEVIHNNKDEIPIKYLKIILLVSYIIMFICDFINIYYSLNFYSKIKKIFNLVQNSSYIRYCEAISVYYVREIILLNFNLTGIKGGEYTNFPAKNREKYLSLIQSQINELFNENLSLIQKLLSSPIITPEKLKNIQYSELVSNDDEISNDIFTLLCQYISDFYLVTLNNVQIANKEEFLFNFIYNNYNKFRNGLNELINTYAEEFYITKKKVIITFIIILIFIILIFAIIFIYVTKYLLSSHKIFINYIKILYGINLDMLNILILECSTLINDLKNEKNNYNFEYEDNFEDKLSLSDNKKMYFKNFSNNISKKIINNKRKNISSNIFNYFILLFCLLILILYSLIIFSFIHLIYILKNSDKMFEMSSYFQGYQIQILDMFNIYREYLYDNETRFLNNTSLEYLRKLEDEIYDTVTKNFEISDSFIAERLDGNMESIYILTNRNFCSFKITDYFDTIEKCNNMYNKFIINDMIYFSNYFLEGIKIGKNIVRYKLQNENIKGNLNNFNRTKLINEIESEFNIDKNVEFRLNLFNNKTIHSYLNAIFFNSLLPYLRNNRNLIFNFISLDGEDSYFIYLGISYLLLLTIKFIGSFIFIIKMINSQINKTKNILSIIPINILIYQNDNKYIIDFLVSK